MKNVISTTELVSLIQQITRRHLNRRTNKLIINTDFETNGQLTLEVDTSSPLIFKGTY